MSVAFSDSYLSSIIGSQLDTAFNSTILEGFVCGMYTLLMGYTLCRLLRQPNRKIYTSTLVILWALVMVAFILDWILKRSAFVIQNSSPLRVFKTISANSNVQALGNAFSAASSLLADGILIWRCFILWPHRKWALSPLLLALVANLIIASFIFFQRPGAHESAAVSARLLLTYFFLSVGITASGTFLIILRILLVTRQSPIKTHRRMYRRIQAVVLESGITYCVAMLLSAVAFSVQVYARGSSSATANVVTLYSAPLLTPLTGIGPTLIAAQSGMRAEDTQINEIRPLTGLAFRNNVNREDELGLGSDSVGTDVSLHLMADPTTEQQHADGSDQAYIASQMV